MSDPETKPGSEEAMQVPAVVVVPRRRVAPHPLEPWAERIVALLDDAFEIPGTGIRFGLDPILGFFAPVIGDLVGGVAALAVLFLAWREGAPLSLLLRMLGNLGADALLGSVPVAGDLADTIFRANRRNLDLLKAFRGADAAAVARSPGVHLGLLILVLIVGLLLVILPLVLASLLLVWVLGRLFGAHG